MQHETNIHELEGGARLLTIHIPNTISYYWASFFKAGYRFVHTDKYEMPHLAEHLAFEGTKRFPDSLDFKLQVERNGAHYNAHTNNMFVWYDFITTAGDLERIIDLNLGQIQSPLYGESQITQEKQVIDKEMNGKKENDSWRLQYLQMHSIMPRLNPDIDQRIENISSITRKELFSYYEKHYGTKNTHFVLAGDIMAIDLPTIIRVLNAGLSAQHSGERHEIRPYEFNRKRAHVYAYDPFHEQQSMFSLRFIQQGEDEDSRAARVTMMHMLTGGMSARLGRKARESGLTYGVGSGAGTGIDASSIAIVSQTNLDKLFPLLELACQELTAIGNGEYADEEMNHAMGHMVGGMRRSHQLPASLAGWYADDFILGKTLESPEAWIARLEAVTREDIRAAYERYVRADNMVLTLIGKDLTSQSERYHDLLGRYFS